MIALARKAGNLNSLIRSSAPLPCKPWQCPISTEFDPEIENVGFDSMRLRIAIRLKDGRTVEGRADERYHGGLKNPLSDKDLEAKVRSCCEVVLDDERQTT